MKRPSVSPFVGQVPPGSALNPAKDAGARKPLRCPVIVWLTTMASTESYKKGPSSAMSLSLDSGTSTTLATQSSEASNQASISDSRYHAKEPSLSSAFHLPFPYRIHHFLPQNDCSCLRSGPCCSGDRLVGRTLSRFQARQTPELVR